MTIKTMMEVVNGRIVLTDKALDADKIELSINPLNKLQVKEDGLFYDESFLQTEIDNLDAKLLDFNNKFEGQVEALDNKLDTEFYTKTAVDTTVETLVPKTSLTNYYNKEEAQNLVVFGIDTHHSTNIEPVFAKKADIKEQAILYKGENKVGPCKIFTAQVQANSDGLWSVDYTHMGFTVPPIVTCSGVATGTAAADKRIASINKDGASTTGVGGHLHSTSSAGLLAAMTMISSPGPVNVIAVGY